MAHNGKKYGKGRNKGRKPRSEEKDFQKDSGVEVNSPFPGKSIHRSSDTRGINDPEWYAMSKQMLNDSARIPFNRPLGYPIDWGYIKTNDIPGIMTLTMNPGPGYSDSAKSAVNLAARNIYTFVRHCNSGHANYDSPDLMIYILAMDAAYQLWAHLRRAYGIAMHYTQANRYMPGAILKAMGFDSQSIQDNMPQFRFIINKFVRKIGSRPVPNNLNILKKHSWLYANIYKDATSKKAQSYMYVPGGFHVYEEHLNQERALVRNLVWHDYANIPVWLGTATEARSTWNIRDIEALCEYMANAILGSEDLGIISGDIMKAYGSNIYVLSEIKDDDFIEPVHSEEVLKQIHNTIISGSINEETMDIKQDASLSIDGGSIIWRPGRHNPSDYYQSFMDGLKLIDSNEDSPSAEEIMVSTRNMCYLLDAYHDGDNVYYGVGCGTEIIKRVDMWIINADGNVFNAGSLTGPFLEGTNVGFGVLSRLSVFDWHPIIYLYSTAGGHIVGLDPFGQLDNYTLIANNNIKMLHETAILSEWDVPETAFYKV